ncbi:BA75_00677T0 [Komagataella pastoris]|uniref:BA75_00677T0 n=1 Tax=Komagataella pastoris TaxID=4922 RepID=A0A1B2J837_PICPA|nr:BA75_00677T0 [Komagataella pastoris]
MDYRSNSNQIPQHPVFSSNGERIYPTPQEAILRQNRPSPIAVPSNPPSTSSPQFPPQKVDYRPYASSSHQQQFSPAPPQVQSQRHGSNSTVNSYSSSPRNTFVERNAQQLEFQRNAIRNEISDPPLADKYSHQLRSASYPEVQSPTTVESPTYHKPRMFPSQRKPPPIIPPSTQKRPQSKEERKAIMMNRFKEADYRRKGYLTESELSGVLRNSDQSTFRPSTVSLMINLFDENDTKTIDVAGFGRLLEYIDYWEEVFFIYDRDHSYSISFKEFKALIKDTGYSLPSSTVEFIFRKHSSNSGSDMRFDSFIESMVWLLRITDSFKKFESKGTGVAVFPFHNFIEEIFSLK